MEKILNHLLTGAKKITHLRGHKMFELEKYPPITGIYKLPITTDSISKNLENLHLLH